MPGAVLNALHKLTQSSSQHPHNCSFPISQIREIETQRDDKASKWASQDSNPGRPTRPHILSADETAKAKNLRKRMACGEFRTSWLGEQRAWAGPSNCSKETVVYGRVAPAPCWLHALIAYF